MAYVRKTRDEFRIMGNFGYGHGWEEMSAYDTRREAIADLKAYRASGQGAYKLVKVRIKVDPSEYAPFSSWQALMDKRYEMECLQAAHKARSEQNGRPCTCSACAPYDLGNGWYSNYAFQARPVI